MSLSLKILLIVASVYLYNYNQTLTTYSLYSQVEMMESRLRAEKDIFDEILFRQYIYDIEDFTYMYEDYLFEVKMSESEVEVAVVEPEPYIIKLVYKDECLCFIEILYL